MPSRPTSPDSVQSLDTVRQELAFWHRSLGSWRKVGELYGLPAGTLASVAKGRDPRKLETRRRLGLSLRREVDVIGDFDPTGAQVGVPPRDCAECGEGFIPNTATRRRCFYCSPSSVG